MRHAALLSVLLIVLPNCAPVKMAGIGIGAAGMLGGTAGFFVLDATLQNDNPPPSPSWDAAAITKGYRVSAGLIGGGLTLVVLGAGLYLFADMIAAEKKDPPTTDPPRPRHPVEETILGPEPPR